MARSLSNLSQRQFAIAAGVPQSVIARYESEAVKPSLEKLSNLLERAGFDLEIKVVTRKKSPSRTHRLHELRSLEFHRRVGERLKADPLALPHARQTVEDWLAGRRPFSGHREYAEAWQGLLAAPVDEVVARITADDETGRELRQNTPFAGVLGDEGWRAVVRDIRRESPATP